ncbi:MAG TPA: DUF4238 domain-containing protein [Thermoanaerobaculia bacterium]|jgi:hypothetical protein|nr:DUF4238 domain-containing protein [Thermoanaerobaculia bacterium]
MAAGLHHHLPRSYQLRFATRGRVHVFDRVTRSFRADTPRNVGAVRDDYTIVHSDGRRDSRVETEFLSRLDDRGARLLEKLSHRVPIYLDEKEDFCWYLSFFLVRGPRFRRMLDELGTAMWKAFARVELGTADDIRRMIMECPDFSDTDRAAADPELLLEMIQREEYQLALNREYAVKLMMEHGSELRELFLKSDWVIAHANDGAEFITSDHPIVTRRPMRTFPLGHDCCLMMIEGAGEKITHRDMPPSMVHAVNLDTARQSERVVIGKTSDYLRRVVSETRVDSTAPDPIAVPGLPSA